MLSPARYALALSIAAVLIACSSGVEDEPAPPAPTSAPASAARPASPAPSGTGAIPTIVPQLAGRQLVEALRGGGYIIVFRHAFTDMTQTDHDPFVASDCGAQRNLNAAGRAQARMLGQEFVRLGIPFGPALTSPYCRAKETAGLAFGLYEVEAALQQQLSGDTASRADALNALFSRVPTTGRNTVMVTHITNLTLLSLPLHAEGDSFVLRPTGSTWTAVAFMPSGEWATLPAP
jgi:phosphohistidine phosphatase SixA